MRGDLTIRKVRMASGATAVQVFQNKGKQRFSLKHIGSAHSERVGTVDGRGPTISRSSL